MKLILLYNCNENVIVTLKYCNVIIYVNYLNYNDEQYIVGNFLIVFHINHISIMAIIIICLNSIKIIIILLYEYNINILLISNTIKCVKFSLIEIGYCWFYIILYIFNE